MIKFGKIKFTNKKLAISSVVVLLLLANLLFWQWRANRLEAKEFAGRIIKIEENSVFMEGMYQFPTRPELMNPGKYTKKVEVVIGPETQFIKELLFMPTKTQLEKSNGMYRPADLNKQFVAGSFDDLKLGKVDGFRVLAARNIYGSKKFAASTIRYIWTVYPQE